MVLSIPYGKNALPSVHGRKNAPVVHQTPVVRQGRLDQITGESRIVRRLHILFIDSDLNTQNKMQQALKDDFVIFCASSVAEAKRCLETFSPDVLISEILLTGHENGLDFCRYVRSVPLLQHLPIMLLTSLATSQDKVAGFAAGTDDYVVKPFDIRHLKARIRLLSRIKRLEERTD